METLKVTLKKPFTSLDGTQIEELILDTGKLTLGDYGMIRRLEKKLNNQGDMSVDVSLLSKVASTEFKIAAGFVCALKSTPHLCLDDFDKLSLPDALEVADVILPFLAGV